jgi:ribonuclease J
MKIRSFKPKTVHNQAQRVNQAVGVLPAQKEMQPSQKSGGGFFNKFRPGGSGTVKLIPLGGVGLVQKNCFVYEYQNDIVVIDCGVSFPNEDMPGVDLVIPDITYLRQNKSKIRGIVITHGHDDHIGGLPYVWPELNVPIYSQKLTCGFIKNKFIEHKLNKDVIKTVGINDTIKLGAFTISFYQAAHSIPDTTGIILSTPAGTLIHQSDFKIDWTPVNGQVTDVAKVARTGDAGVTLLTIDCLRAEKQGYTPSEKTIEETFENLEKKAKGKFVITLMTSNITRIQQAINVAERSGRKIAFFGRSMENNFQVARDLGYLDIPPNLVVAPEETKRFADEKLMLVMAGSLGQPGSALSRAANNDHRFVRLKKGDIVVFSADPMPSAEVSQGELIDSLTKLGVEVYASNMMSDLHVSGHAASEELKVMIGLIRPKFLMPIGGEFRHMHAFARLAMSLGYKEDQILIPREGQMLDVTSNKVHINGGIETSNVYVDGLGIGDVGSIVLRDRQVMSEEGVVIVIVPLAKSGQLGADIDIISRGFVFEQSAEELLEQARQIATSCLKERGNGRLDWRYARKNIETSLEKFFYQEIKRNPLILPIVVEV